VALLDAGRAITAATSVTAVHRAVEETVPVVLDAQRCSVVEARESDDVLPGPGGSEAGATGRILSTPIRRGGNVVAYLQATRGDWAGEFGDEEQRLAAFVAALAGARLDQVAGNGAQFRALVRNSHDLTIVTDASGRTLYVSPSVTPMLGYAPSDITTLDGRLIHPDDRQQVVDAFRLARFSPATRPATSVRARHGDGSWRWLEMTITNLLADASVSGLVWNIRDITQRRASEEHLTFLALHDPLTGLANRRLLLDRLSMALARRARSGRMVAVLYLDLDRFKDVNDSLGHEQGDQLLLQAAARLGEQVRGADTLARLGGDEFVLVADDLAGPADAVAIAERIEESFALPFDLPGGARVLVTASVGVAMADDDAEPTTLLRHADAAMYQAKERGRACHQLFDPLAGAAH